MKTEEKAKAEKKPTNRAYLSYVAERIASERPSVEMITQTLADIDERGYGRGYVARTRDSSKFKDFQRRKRDESWSSIKDFIDDSCHKGEEAVINPNEV